VTTGDAVRDRRRRATGRVCMIATSGGHLAQLELLAPAVRGFDAYVVTVPSDQASDVFRGSRRYFVRQILRNPASFVVNFVQSLRIFLKERPEAVVTTGAGDVLPTVLIAAALGSTVVFVESFSRVSKPSLIGRIARRWCDRVFVQWAELQGAYPTATHVTPLFAIRTYLGPIPASPSILVLTGTHTRGFERLLETLDGLTGTGRLAGRVVAQIGHSTYVPHMFESFRFEAHQDLLHRMEAADIIITHDGAASIGEALSLGKPTVVVPRMASAGEVSYSSAQDLARHLARSGMVALAEDPQDLPDAIAHVRDLARVPPLADVPRGIDLIRQFLEERAHGPRRGSFDEGSARRAGSIVLVAPANPWEPRASGIRSYTEALVEGLSKSGSRVTVVTIGLPPPAPLANVNVLALSSRRRSSFVFILLLFLHGLRVRSAGPIVHLQRLDHLLGLLPFVVSKRTLVTLHGNSVRSIQEGRGRLHAVLYRSAEVIASWFADTLIAVDPETAAAYAGSYPRLRESISTIPIGTTASADMSGPFRSSVLDAVPPDAKVVLFAGRFEAEKRIDLLVDSFGLVLQEVPDAFLVLVGEGPMGGRLKEHIEGAGLDRVLFLPVLGRQPLESLLRRADVVAIPSRFEAGPLLALEAIAAGTPIVSTRVGRMPEILNRWTVGRLVEPDIESFAGALVNVLEEGKKPFAEGCRIASKELSFDSTLQRTLPLYRALGELEEGS